MGMTSKNGSSSGSGDTLPDSSSVSVRAAVPAEPTLSSKRLMQGGLQNIQPKDNSSLGLQNEGANRHVPAQESAPALPPPQDDAVQALIAMLKEENRKLTEEKIVLQRDLQRPRQQAAQPFARSPDRVNNNPGGGYGNPYGGANPCGAGALGGFRQLQQPPQQQSLHGDYGYGHGPAPAPALGMPAYGASSMYGGASGGGYGPQQAGMGMGMGVNAPYYGGQFPGVPAVDPQQQQMMM